MVGATGLEPADHREQITDTPGTNQAQTAEPQGVANDETGQAEDRLGHPKDGLASAPCCTGVAQGSADFPDLTELGGLWPSLAPTDRQNLLALARSLTKGQEHVTPD